MDDLAFDTYGMTNETVAKIFAAYLLGSRAFDPLSQVLSNGPFQKEGSEDRWILDSTNDYWLHFENGRARLVARYSTSGDEVCRTMLQLYQLRHQPRRSAGGSA